MPLRQALRPPMLEVFLVLLAAVGPGCRTNEPPQPTHGSTSSSNASDAVDEVIRGLMARERIPGIALLVAQKGVVSKRGYYGLGDVARGTPVHARTAFQIASMSKAFTDAAVLLLAEEGKLAIDDPLSRWIPEAPPTWSGITLRMLMNHTSGIAEDWRLHEWDEVPPFFLRNTSDQDFLNAAFATPLDFPPGTHARYSHGPFFLGVVIARASGKSYAQFMEERVFRPLGLQSTHVNDTSRAVPDRASGYLLSEGRLTNGHPISPAASARGDVGILSTADDLFAWYSQLRAGKLIHDASLQDMFTPARVAKGGATPWGLGWLMTPMRAYPSIGHNGGFRTGFCSAIRELPVQQLVVIVLANRANADPGGIAQRVIACYEPELRPISDHASSGPDAKAPQRNARFARVLASIARGEVDRQLMSETFPIEAFDADTREFLSGVAGVDDLGSEVVAGRDSAPFGTHVRELRYCRLRGKETAYTAFALDEEGKVAWLEQFEDG